MAVLSAPNACFLNPAALPRGCLAEPLTLVFTPSVAANRDDALWALDGLASGHDATTRDSLAALAEICATRRGRLALRSGSLAADVLAAAGRLAGGAGVACSACCCLLARIACMLDLHSSKPISFCACPPLPAPTGALKVQRDPVQALGLATLLLCFCQADADATLLGRQDVAAGAAQLLKVRFPGPLAGLGSVFMLAHGVLEPLPVQLTIVC
jgi:hypothetical protein